MPEVRSGIEQQGVYGLENSFEYTDSGTYFLCSGYTGNYILYGDHGSNTIIKLCGRADCAHNSAECNSYFTKAENICYYDGHLYTCAGMGPNKELIRMNLDGSNRISLYSLRELYAQNGYTGTVGNMIWNGYHTFGATSLDDSGNDIIEYYYYKLDGTMDTPQRADFQLALFSHGTDFLVEQLTDDSTSLVCRWEAKENETSLLTTGMGQGYYSNEAVWFFEDGKILCYTYETRETEVLLETGLIGSYRLICFPDCLLLASTEDHMVADRCLYIYNWAFELVDTVALDYPLYYRPSCLIVGETHERIILSDSTWSIPRYYIEKSELGSGNVRIHEYNLPDLTEELAMIDEELSGD